MMETICDRRLCTGCAACVEICPFHAVEMAADPEGFLFPVVNEKRCTDCGLCARACPVNLESKRSLMNIVGGTAKPEDPAALQYPVYACFSKDEDIRANSTSGGVFSKLALKVLSEGGVVFGAGFDEEFSVIHKSVQTPEELDDLRRSKYVQSRIGNVYNETKKLLKSGKKVLFCGTPCQIAGLKATLLGKEYPELLSCDLACHGVPSPKIWEMFLDDLRSRYNSKVTSVSFRDKTTGWTSSSMKVTFENGSQYADRVQRETFFIGFGKSIFNRRSCYSCPFRIQNTKADLTLADFWGIDKQGDSDFTDNKGVSLIIAHTAAGEQALSDISGELVIKPRELEEAVRYNPRLVSSVAEPAGRKNFFSDLRAGADFRKLRARYMDNFSILYRAKVLAKQVITLARKPLQLARNGAKGHNENKTLPL